MEVIFKTKEDAEAVWSRLRELISQYDYVAVNDLKQLIGEDTSHLSRDQGWTSLDGVTLYQAREGWTLRLPDPDRVG